MLKRSLVYLQYLLPQHFLTRFVGLLAECRLPWFKNLLIRLFIHRYKVNVHEAVIEDYRSYPSFNDFFIRQLKPGIRPIAEGPQDIACPADGIVAEIGQINKNQLLQAKGFYFNLETLLGGDAPLAESFYDGSFATIYLAPHHYHRFHMPISGTLVKTIYVPGRLFSVNLMTSRFIPHLYSRNERINCIFKTDAGQMAVIIVGALIVGSIKTVWMNQPIRANHLITETFTNGITLGKGEELGYFKMGSTVILLYPKNTTTWDPSLKLNSLVQVGQRLGNSLRLP